MPSNWQLTTLGAFVTLQRGHDLPEPERRHGNIPILGSFGITGYHNNARATGPGVTIGRSGASIGTASYSPVDYWPLNTSLYVIDFHGNNELFAYYFLKNLSLHRFNSGSAQPSLNRNHIHPIPVIIPPLPEQKAIAHILGTLDDKIELNRRMNATLEAIAQAIFKSWFVDFDPVKAKAEGRQPYGMDAVTAALFPDGFEESELGPVPRGWKLGRLSQIATLEMQPTSPSTYPSKIWEHYSIPAYDKGRQPALELGEDIKSGKYVVPEYCVLASKLNPQFPRVWLPDIQDTDSAICSTEFMPFIPNDTGWRPYLYEMLQSDTVQSEILNRATGSTGSRQRVKPKEIAVIPCIVHPKALIDFFCTKASSLHDKQLSNARRNGTLASLRDTLLPKLMSGELRVAEEIAR